MTLVVTVKHPSAIIMSADSRQTDDVTRINSDGNPIGPTIRKFTSTQKLYPVPGAGSLCFWGDILRLQSKLPRLKRAIKQVSSKNIIALKDSVDTFLRDVLAPHRSEQCDEVGFHVAGYDANDKPVIFHVFWGWQADEDREITPPAYHVNFHSDDDILFNGQYRHASAIFGFLAQLRYEVGLKTWIGDYGTATAARFNDYLIRYTGRLEETVGDAILNNIILPDNRQYLVVNMTKYPLDTGTLSFHLHQFEQSGKVVDSVIFRRVKLHDSLIGGSPISPVAW